MNDSTNNSLAEISEILSSMDYSTIESLSELPLECEVRELAPEPVRELSPEPTLEPVSKRTRKSSRLKTKPDTSDEGLKPSLSSRKSSKKSKSNDSDSSLSSKSKRIRKSQKSQAPPPDGRCPHCDGKLSSFPRTTRHIIDCNRASKNGTVKVFWKCLVEDCDFRRLYNNRDICRTTLLRHLQTVHHISGDGYEKYIGYGNIGQSDQQLRTQRLDSQINDSNEECELTTQSPQFFFSRFTSIPNCLYCHRANPPPTHIDHCRRLTENGKIKEFYECLYDNCGFRVVKIDNQRLTRLRIRHHFERFHSSVRCEDYNSYIVEFTMPDCHSKVPS